MNDERAVGFAIEGGKRMTFLGSTINRSASIRASVLSLAHEYGAREVWLFGSSTARANPHDIDVAVLGVPGCCLEEIARTLQTRFPSSRVDGFAAYWKVRASPKRSPPFHFVLAEDSSEFRDHAIRRTIRAGVCLWRAH